MDKYKNKNETIKALSVLLAFKYGGVKQRKHLNTVAKNLDMNPNKYKNKTNMSKIMKQRTSKVNYKNAM